MGKNIMPFHMFEYQDKNYVINIENMTANSISEETDNELKLTKENPQLPLSQDLEILKKKKLDPIVNMALLVTQSCNLRCIYCYGDGGEYGTGGSMEDKTAFKAIDWLIKQSGEAKKLNIIFFGGEPFLNFELMKKVVNYANKSVAKVGKRIGYSVTTNGTLLDDDKISFIKENEIKIIVSIDGPKEIQDKQRPFAGGKGSYDVIMPKILNLIKAVPDTRAHAVLTDDENIPIIKNALEKVGFSEVSIIPASASLFDNDIEKAKQKRRLNGVLKEMEKEKERWLKHIKNKDSEALKELLKNTQLYEGVLSLLHGKKKKHACGAGLKYVGVSCSGDVYLCHRFVGMEEYKLGNIFKGSLDREKYQESPITQVEECINCFAKYYCAGGCRHDNAFENELGFKPAEDMCTMRRRELELAAVVFSALNEDDKTFLNDYEIFPHKPCPLDL